jgi:hypothetical protein
MRHRNTLILGVLVGGLSTWCGAELPPSAYWQMQQGASEHLDVQILSFKRAQIGGGMERLMWTAKITRVYRSKSRLKVGNKVAFSIEQNDGKKPGWVGPSLAPGLSKGTKTMVFLNSTGSKSFVLAKRGRSFETMADPNVR